MSITLRDWKQEVENNRKESIRTMMLISDVPSCDIDGILLTDFLTSVYQKSKRDAQKVHSLLLRWTDNMSIYIQDFKERNQTTILPPSIENDLEKMCVSVTRVLRRYLDKETFDISYFINDWNIIEYELSEIKNKLKTVSERLPSSQRRKTSGKSVMNNTFVFLSNYGTNLFFLGLVLFEGWTEFQQSINVWDMCQRFLIILCILASNYNSIRKRITDIIMEVSFALTKWLFSSLISLLTIVAPFMTNILSSSYANYATKTIYNLCFLFCSRWLSKTYRTVCRILTRLASLGSSAILTGSQTWSVFLETAKNLSAEQFQAYLYSLTTLYLNPNIALFKQDILKTVQENMLGVQSFLTGYLSGFWDLIMTYFKTPTSSTGSVSSLFGVGENNEIANILDNKNIVLGVEDRDALMQVKNYLTDTTELSITGDDLNAFLTSSLKVMYKNDENGLLQPVNHEIQAAIAYGLNQKFLNKISSIPVTAFNQAAKLLAENEENNELYDFYQRQIGRLEGGDPISYVDYIYKFLYGRFLSNPDYEVRIMIVEYFIIQILYFLIIKILE